MALSTSKQLLEALVLLREDESKVQKELVYKKAEEYLLQAESNLKQDVSSQKLPNIATDNQNNL
jgi:hypothetical protein